MATASTQSYTFLSDVDAHLIELPLKVPATRDFSGIHFDEGECLFAGFNLVRSSPPPTTRQTESPWPIPAMQFPPTIIRPS